MPTSLDKNNLLQKILEVLISEGVEGFKPILEWLLNEAMKMERSNFLGADHYERSPERKGYANGFKEKSILTRHGKSLVRIPQVRGLSFYPSSLEKGCKSEVALKCAIAEMYVQGVSTRKVTEITEALCGLEISSSQVSRISKELDVELNKFRERPLGEIPFLILDARYEKIRYEGRVQNLAVLVAIGVNPDGYREVLGVSVSLSEAEIHWRTFLKSLQKRGLYGVQMILSDAHEGLRKARKSLFPATPWQRCQFHLQQNAQAFGTSKPMKLEIGQDIRDIFNACSLIEAKEKLKNVATKYEKKSPHFTHWLEDNLEEGFTVFSLPRTFWKRLRTSNLLENTNKEIKRRTRVATLFPNQEACLRLVSAILQELHEEWVCGKKYLNMELLNNQTVNPNHRIYRKNVA